LKIREIKLLIYKRLALVKTELKVIKYIKNQLKIQQLLSKTGKIHMAQIQANQKALKTTHT